MKALIVDNGTVFRPELVKLLSELNIETVVIERELFRKGMEQDFNLLVLSGGHAANTNVLEHQDMYKEELEAIRTSPIPILGICLGFQLIAASFGGTIYKLEEKIRGVFPIQKMEDSPILEGVTNLDVFESHKYAVKSISLPGIAVAKSENGLEIVEIKGQKIIGFQFHPEMYISEKGSRQMIHNFIKMII